MRDLRTERCSPAGLEEANSHAVNGLEIATYTFLRAASQCGEASWPLADDQQGNAGLSPTGTEFIQQLQSWKGTSSFQKSTDQQKCRLQLCEMLSRAPS